MFEEDAERVLAPERPSGSKQKVFNMSGPHVRGKILNTS